MNRGAYASAGRSRVGRASVGSILAGVIAEGKGENAEGGIGANQGGNAWQAKQNHSKGGGSDSGGISGGEDQDGDDECIFHGGGFGVE